MWCGKQDRSIVVVVGNHMPAGPTARSRSSQRRPVGRCCLGPLCPPESAGGCAVQRCLQWFFPKRCCPSVHEHHHRHMSACQPGHPGQAAAALWVFPELPVWLCQIDVAASGVGNARNRALNPLFASKHRISWRMQLFSTHVQKCLLFWA